jgi:rhamnosyltransferase
LLLKKLSTKKLTTPRILFYVHYNKYGILEDYVVYQIEKMRPIFDTVVFISNSQVSEKDLARLSDLYDVFLQRENIGFDFAAWRDGMSHLGWEKIHEYDELTIMNDTCFGPVHDFQKVYDSMQAKGLDFWGTTINLAQRGLVKDERGSSVFVPAHIQSYYITFNKRVIDSDAFIEFWNGVRDYDNVTKVILRYEILLTQTLAKQGFAYGAFYDPTEEWGTKTIRPRNADLSAVATGDLDKYNPGYTCVRPLWLLDHVEGYPFIKTKFILMVPEQIPAVREYIIEKTNYPIQLLDSYISSRHYDYLYESIESRDKMLEMIINSKRYRIGRTVTAPSRVAKRVLNKLRGVSRG